MYGNNLKIRTMLGVLVVCAMLVVVPSLFLAEKMTKNHVKIGIPKWSDKELVLNLVIGSFTPGKELNIIPKALQKTNTEDYDYYIIQFKGPILREWKEAVEKEGVILQNYLPNYAFIAGMKRDIVNTVFSKEYVNYIG
ncbi:MAG: hypothetical protein QXE27_03745, partial [Thermoplasmata archaeon]